MGKAAILAPMYISVAWTLMVTYQFFTETAVSTIAIHISSMLPQLGVWISSRIDMVVFVHAFAWVFLLSSAIPSIILGKGRSVLVQFTVCLTVTFFAFVIQDILLTYGGGVLNQILSLTGLFQNPLLAVGYLSLPYLLMLGIDMRSRRKQKRRERLETATTLYLEDATGSDEGTEQEDYVEVGANMQEEDPIYWT